MFKKLTFERDLAMLDSIKITIWIDGDTIHYSKGGTFIMPDVIDDSISSIKKNDFLKRLESLGIPSWKKNYEPVGYVVLDGELWSIKYETDDAKPVKTSGTNAYPACWKAFEKLLRDVAGDPIGFE